jgi:hypothetical protein
MTVSSSTARVSYSGNGSTVDFAVGFYFLENSHLQVIIRAANGTETVKTITTDYTVAGAGNPAGGTVTMLTAPVSGETLVVVRNVPLTQQTDYQANDPFPAESHEEALDKLTMLTQQLQDGLTRSIKLSRTNTMSSTEFTVGAVDRANKILAFDSAGEIAVTQEIGTYRGNWSSGTAFRQRDLVKDTSNDNIYICVTAHTSSGSQPISSNADVAKWALIVDAAAAASSAAAAAASAAAAALSETAAELAETNAETAETNAETAQAAAEAAQAAAEAAQAAAETAETNAETAETNAETAETNAETAQAAAEAAQASAEAVLVNADFVAVADDLTGANTIGTVAGISADVTTVATNNANVTTVATNIAAINTAASDIADIIVVANDLNEAVSEIEVVADNITDVQTVGDNIADVTAVADDIANVNTVADDIANVNAVAANATNINTVAGIDADITTVAGIEADVQFVADNVADITNFADVYQGGKATAPTLRNDGSALQIGDLYFNTVSNAMFVYASTGWVPAGSSVNGTSRRFRYISTAGQTTFTGTDSNGNTMAYDAGFVDVYLNGVRLDQTDYTATSGTSIVLAAAAALNDELNVVAFGTFSVANINGVDIVDGTVTPNKLDRAYVNKAGDTMTGPLTVNGPNGFKHNGFGALTQYFDTANYDAIRFMNAAGSTEYVRVGYDLISGSGIARIEGLGANSQVHLVTNNASRLTVDSAGRVTMPYQPAFAAHTTPTTISPGAVIYSATRINIGGHYSTSTGRFTAPVTGQYLFTACLRRESTDPTITWFRIPLRKNGVLIQDTQGNIFGHENGRFSAALVTTIVNLSAGDFLEVSYEANGNVNTTTTPAENGFSGYFLG